MSTPEGWLVVNHFVVSDKFSELYDLLTRAANKIGVRLTVRRTGELLCPVGAAFEAFGHPDFVLFWDKDILLARRLELAGIPVFNSAEAIEWCDNKALTAIRLAEHRIPTPRTVLSPKTYERTGYATRDFVRCAGEQVGFPMVIKENYGSFGQQVYLAHDLDEADRIVDGMGCKGFLMQQFIAESAGRDVRINVVGGQVVAAMERFSVTGDFRSNITNGGHMRAVTPTAEQTDLAVRACRALKLDFAGVDVLFGADGPLICEVNSNPHFKSTLDCTGVDMGDYIMAYVRGAV